MYEQFYGLKERPFELTPNPRYLLLTPMHQEALSSLEYAISARRGIAVLIGEAGTGKTTLLRKVLEHGATSSTTASGDAFVYLNNPALSRAEFFQLLGERFGLGAGLSKLQLLRELESALVERHARGHVAALIVDEAQSMPHELLEELRLLANIESAAAQLLQLVLAGQPELGDRLNDPSLRQFKQRVAVRCRLMPFEARETLAYIDGRVRLAGGDPIQLFTRDAVIAVHHASSGIPRTISVICDDALLAGFAGDERPVDRATVEEVCRDLDLACLTVSVAKTQVPRLTDAVSFAAPNRHCIQPAVTSPLVEARR
jgi:general secretion pathway protein A